MITIKLKNEMSGIGAQEVHAVFLLQTSNKNVTSRTRHRQEVDIKTNFRDTQFEKVKLIAPLQVQFMGRLACTY
jgi:hypothetical protein